MIMEMLSAFGFSYGLTKYLNEDFFYAKQTAERNNTHCEFKYVEKLLFKMVKDYLNSQTQRVINIFYSNKFVTIYQRQLENHNYEKTNQNFL